MKPTLFLDVDGVLSREDCKPNGYIDLGAGRGSKQVSIPDGLVMAHRLRRLMQEFDIVWATAWLDYERDALLDFVGIEEKFPSIDYRQAKLLCLLAYVERHTVERWVWVDDYALTELAELGLDWEQLRGGLILAPEPQIGLQDDHIDAALNWAQKEYTVTDATIEEKGVQPHAYEMGKVNFRDIMVKVDPRVLVPRRESGLLVDIATQLPQARHVHEVGTGSGAIAKAIKTERPDLCVTASDVAADALEVARENLDGMRVPLFEGSMLEPLVDHLSDIPDLIVANLPYITEESAQTRSATLLEEPHIAVFDNAGDGLGLIRQLIGQAEGIHNQRIALEHDTHHGAAVREMLSYAVTLRDQDGEERATVGVVR